MNALERFFLKLAVKRFLKESGMGGFLLKFFSGDSIISRIARALSLAISYIAGLGHTPNTLNEWAAVITAFLGGLIAAGQNNPSPVAESIPKAVPPAA